MKNHRGLVVSLAIGSFATACQELDPNLASGNGVVAVDRAQGGAGGAGGSSNASGGAGGVGNTDPCVPVRAQAWEILNTNCAYCHQAPQNGNSIYKGSFNFILQLDQISTLKSLNFPPPANGYIKVGDPDNSLIYFRIQSGQMPPTNISDPRPSTSDTALLRTWIANCASGAEGFAPPPDAGTSPGAGGTTGAGGVAGDASVADCGTPGQSCCAGNSCNAGGCCVGGTCHGHGTACSVPPPQPGQPPAFSLSGTCTFGSCQTADGGLSCGSVGEPCCEANSCTATQSACLTGTDLSGHVYQGDICSACGATGQPCCTLPRNSCLPGRVCLNGGAQRVGSCGVCGGVGQPCCGSGTVVQQTCNHGLTCAVVGTSNLCLTDGGIGNDGADSGDDSATDGRNGAD
jgi:hypothetical protein